MIKFGRHTNVNPDYIAPMSVGSYDALTASYIGQERLKQHNTHKNSRTEQTAIEPLLCGSYNAITGEYE